MKPSAPDLYAWELHWETAAATLLALAGLPVISPYLPRDPLSGEPILKGIPDHHCIVTFEPAATDDSQRVFATGVVGAVDEIDSIEAGWGGDLIVEHTVPAGDEPAQPGQQPECYPRFCAQAGLIRATILAPREPFAAILPQYNVLSVRFQPPTRNVDAPRAANRGTERFRIRYMPATGML
jgi:hypothetical protein